MDDVVEKIKEKIKGKKNRIVFPESEDERVLKAASELAADGVIRPYLIGAEPTISKKAEECGVSLDGIEIRDPDHDTNSERYAEMLYELRKEKGLGMEEANKLLKDNIYFAIMMLKSGDAEGLVCGAMHSTADTVRPALQVLKTEEGHSIASSFFLMITKEGNELIFADCGINIDPDEESLAEIAISTAQSARILDIEPRVAMLSFSTKGSAKHEKVDKVRRATEILKEKNVDFAFDGELQLDAAIVPRVSVSKSPDSPLGGNANILIFPDLGAGNIGYKLVERFAGAKALGPIIQGIGGAVNDVSRGCSKEDIMNVSVITALQASLKR